VFVKSCDNDADLFTKSVSKDIYNENFGKFLGKVNEELKKKIGASLNYLHVLEY
jgi:hypothetical protein